MAQKSLHCPGGRARVLARGMCAVCYTLLLELWREQHPRGYEQPDLDFGAQLPPAVPIPLIPR